MASTKVLSLAIRVAGDGSRLRLTSAERALASLQAETEKVGAQFEKFADQSEAGARAAQQFATDSAFLLSAVKTGQLGVNEFAQEFAKLSEEADETAAALRRAADLTTKYETEAARFARTQAELNELFDAGQISLEVYGAAIEDAASGLSDVERAAAGLSAIEDGGDALEDIALTGDEATTTTRELAESFRVLPGFLGTFVDTSINVAANATAVADRLSNLGDSFRALIGPTGLAARALQALTTPLGQVAAALAVSGGIVAGLSALSARVQNLNNLAQRLGISFEFIQILETSAKRAGTSVDAVAFAFSRLQRTLLNAGEESKKAVAALEAVGLTSQELINLAPQEQYERIGQALLSIEDPARRTAAAIELFGKSGASLLPFFQELEGAAEDFRRFGAGITDEDRDRVLAFNSALDTLSKALSRLAEEAILPFAGLATGILEAGTRIVSAVVAVADSVGNLLTPALDQLGRVVGFIGTVIEGLAGLFRTLAGVIEPIGRFLLPAVVAQLVFMNRAILVGAVTRLAVSFSTAATTAGLAASLIAAYATSATGATVATVALGGAVRRLLASTGIGAAVVVFGLAVEALASWAFSANEVTDATGGAGDAIGDAAERSQAFEASLNSLTQSVGEAIEESAKFGQAGFDAALQYQQAIERLKADLDRGLFNEETFRREAEKARVAFKTELDRLGEEARLEIQIEENARQTVQGLREQISGVIDDSARFGQAGFDAALQFQNALDGLIVKFESGVLNEQAVAREAKRAKEEYEGQAKALEEAVRAQQQLIDNDRKRIETLLQSSDSALKISEDLAAVEREIARVQEQIAEAAGDDAAEAEVRLRSLQELQSRLDDDLQAAAQGFENGFAKAFEEIGKGFSDSVKRASEFGNEGAKAAAALQEGIARAQQQARDGIFNRAAFDAEVAAQQKIFEDRVKRLEELKKREQDAIRARFDAEVAANNRLQQFLNANNVGGRNPVAAQAAEERIRRQQEAAQNLVAIERQIALTRQSLEAAREQGDRRAAGARAEELRILQQLGRQERLIAEGKAAERQQQRQFLQEQAEVAQRLAEQEAESQQQLRQEQQRVQEERFRAEAEEFERQSRRIRALNSIGQQSVGGGDIRTSEGANQFIQAAAGAFDPNLAEARSQTRLLARIALNSGALQFLERGIGSTFQFLGGGA